MPDPLEQLRRAAAAATGTASADSSDYDLSPGVALPPDRRLRPASVLVGWAEGPAGPELVLTKRSAQLLHHPGQIALPGGKREPDDPTPEATALREAHEEIGLDPARVEVLGRLPRHETVTGFTVTPVLAWIDGDFQPRLQASEVAELFRVPFTHVADPGRYRVERRQWQGQWRSYYTIPWGPYYIWGATARILQGLAQRLTR